ncbi:hypothetical protein OAW_17215 [Vibrio cyclitrophicus ZF170]|uniref:hypothetical protein n=1 Tax=Vibrio cyclitrophicus TaxID=47951 RepID=UPI000367E7FC|nr:hypothetical protein [Vibrio cyclitrophicus]OEE27404.1 hypothetical protein OAW_17215 [Vibrio cyclitrophicus ZF170]
MKRLILNITLLVFMALGSMNAMAHDSTVKYGIAISHDGEQIAYGNNKWVSAFYVLFRSRNNSGGRT